MEKNKKKTKNNLSNSVIKPKVSKKGTPITLKCIDEKVEVKTFETLSSTILSFRTYVKDQTVKGILHRARVVTPGLRNLLGDYCYIVQLENSFYGDFYDKNFEVVN